MWVLIFFIFQYTILKLDSKVVAALVKDMSTLLFQLPRERNAVRIYTLKWCEPIIHSGSRKDKKESVGEHKLSRF